MTGRMARREGRGRGEELGGRGSTGTEEYSRLVTPEVWR